MIDAGFWRGRRVLVTGHTGFKGAWLTLWLHALGAELHGFASGPPTTPSMFALARMDEVVPTITGDVRELAAVEAAVGESRPEVVFTSPRRRSSTAPSRSRSAPTPPMCWAR